MLLQIDKYTVTPAVNGWVVTFRDNRSDTTHTAVFKTSLELSKFFVNLDSGRVKAKKLASSATDV